MPAKPLKPCAVPSCPNLTQGRYCQDHQHKEQQDKSHRHRYYDEHLRDQKAREFYHSKEWQRVRQVALVRDNYLCQHCLRNNRITSAEVVDHVIPIRVDWSLRLSLGNLQSLCNACHNKKTAEDKQRYGEGRVKNF
ncbi:HNH endonuclease [Geobacillus vulcani]|uniref:HNH endonuclease n=1 Tax=Geobacillus vulcani TaxID=135517 RepID=UPI0004DF496C|nr:HNH endonuclease signature motif containing protein [Geobacillus vulcani]